MKRILILGAGTAGTMMANKLATLTDRSQWKITLVDQNETHYYQPGFLFIPFGIYKRQDIVKPRREFVPDGVEFIVDPIKIIHPEANTVALENGNTLAYDLLIIATGSVIAPEQVEGMTGEGWRKNIFDFYTIDGALALHTFLETWKGGRLVVNIAEMPIKCPVAPMEFTFLADWWFAQNGIRNAVDITFVTPLPGAFTKPACSNALGNLLKEKNIKLVTDYSIGRVDAEKNVIISWDEHEIPYDLLVTIPTNMGAPLIQRSGMGDDLNFIPTDPHTLRSKKYENVFVIGDATDVPASKAGSTAHFESEILATNIVRAMEGLPLKPEYDGHVNCYIESGYGKAIMIDFNYETEPLPGKFPLPGIGPFTLLGESEMNHWGKMMFRWMYWNVLLKGAELPIGSQLSMAGKEVTA
ncbi:MAG TPA: FAD-dependent oxidoreductase [Candidatus Kapabacteria bacterium]|nr:FAD-dependent oxidoreductase [Candidatus Kapabacteria bacterium]